MVQTSTVQLMHSSMYELARKVSLTNHLEPDILVRMMAEADFDAEFTRTEANGDNTRIFIRYVGRNKRVQHFLLEDDVRLTRKFPIDKFVSQYLASQGGTFAKDTPEEQVRHGSLMLLRTAVSSVLGYGEDIAKSSLPFMEAYIRSVVAIYFDDPLDVVVEITESDNKEEPNLTAMWVLHPRNHDVDQEDINPEEEAPETEN